MVIANASTRIQTIETMATQVLATGATTTETRRRDGTALAGQQPQLILVQRYVETLRDSTLLLLIETMVTQYLAMDVIITEQKKLAGLVLVDQQLLLILALKYVETVNASTRTQITETMATLYQEMDATITEIRRQDGYALVDHPLQPIPAQKFVETLKDLTLSLLTVMTATLHQEMVVITIEIRRQDGSALVVQQPLLILALKYVVMANASTRTQTTETMATQHLVMGETTTETRRQDGVALEVQRLLLISAQKSVETLKDSTHLLHTETMVILHLETDEITTEQKKLVGVVQVDQLL